MSESSDNTPGSSIEGARKRPKATAGPATVEVVAILTAVHPSGRRSQASKNSSNTVASLTPGTIGELVDDTDGKKADETVSFGLDGQNFEINLSARNAQSLREALRPYTQAGRRFAPGRETLHAPLTVIGDRHDLA